MFINIWDKENKAIKINEFSKDLLSHDYYTFQYNDAVNKLVADYGIVLEGNKIKTDYYKIHFYSQDDNYLMFNDILNFLTLFDCFTFLISDTFSYLYESEDINFIEIKAGNKTMFKYDNRE
jgi:hypothetical protein